MADLKMVVNKIHVETGDLENGGLVADNVRVEAMRTEAVICYLDTENYCCAYLNFNDTSDAVQENESLRLMRFLKNCNTNVILVENTTGDYLFITDEDFAKNMIEVMRDFVDQRKLNAKVASFSSSVKKDLSN